MLYIFIVNTRLRKRLPWKLNPTGVEKEQEILSVHQSQSRPSYSSSVVPNKQCVGPLSLLASDQLRRVSELCTGVTSQSSAAVTLDWRCFRPTIGRSDHGVACKYLSSSKTQFTYDLGRISPRSTPLPVALRKRACVRTCSGYPRRTWCWY